MPNLSPTLFARWEEIAIACGFTVGELFADEEHPNRPAGWSSMKNRETKRPLPGGLLHFRALESDNILWFGFRLIPEGKGPEKYSLAIHSPVQLECYPFGKPAKDKNFSHKEFDLRFKRGMALADYLDTCLTQAEVKPYLPRDARYYLFPRVITNWDACLSLPDLNIEYQWPPQQFGANYALCIHATIKYCRGEIQIITGPALSPDGVLNWSFLHFRWFIRGLNFPLFSHPIVKMAKEVDRLCRLFQSNQLPERPPGAGDKND